MKKLITIICIMALVASTLMPAAYASEARKSALSCTQTVRDGENVVFTIGIDSSALDYEVARLVVCSYDEDGKALCAASGKVSDAASEKKIALPYNEAAVRIKAMLLDSDNKLIPLTPPLESEISYDTMSREYTAERALLSALDITNINGLDKIKPDHKITRGEFAVALMRAAGISDEAQYFKADSIFSDVPSEHSAAGYINIAASGGIIAGVTQTSFCPDDSISLDDALKASVRILGYDSLTTADNGYSDVAEEIGITAEINNSQYLDGESFAKLMTNVLHTPVMELCVVTESPDADDREVLEGVTLLTKRDIYIATGLVSESSADEIEFVISKDSPCGTFTTKRPDCTFFAGSSNIRDYTLQLADVYVRKNGRSFEALYALPCPSGKAITVNSDKIASITGTTLTYYPNPEDNSQTEEIKTDFTDILLNFAPYRNQLSELVSGYRIVELTIIENTGDDVYDAVFATEYHNDIVASVSCDKNEILLDNSGRIYLDSAAAATIILEDSFGSPLDLSDFGTGDSVAVVADSDNPSAPKRYDSYIKIIKTSDKTFAGTIEGLYAGNGTGYITVRGKTYPSIDSFEYGVGDYCRFYLSPFGEIFHVTSDTSEIPFYGDTLTDQGSDAAGQEDTLSYEELSQILFALGITDSVHADASRPISRAEFAKVLCTALGGKAQADELKSQNTFSDVAQSHPCSGEINYLAQMGIMQGIGGRFLPEDTISYPDAAEAILLSLGFEPMINAYGQNPLTHIRLFNLYGINDSVVHSGTVTSDVFVRMIFNAITTPVMEEMPASESETTWVIMNNANGIGYETLLTRADTYIVNATVTSANDTFTDVTVTDDSDDGRFVSDGNFRFASNGCDTDALYMQNVLAFVRETAKDTYKIVHCIPSQLGETVTITADKVTDIYDDYRTCVEYIAGYDGANKIYGEIHLSDTVYISLNGAAYDGQLASLADEPFTELKFIENNGDNLFDAVIATTYAYATVETVDADTGSITMTDGSIVTLNSADTQKTVLLRDKSGKVVNTDGFESGDFVAFVSDSGSLSQYDSYLKLINIRENKAIHTVRETYQSGGTRYIVTTANITYPCNTQDTLAAGEVYTLYIGMLSEVVGAVPSEEDAPAGNPSIPDRGNLNITVPEDACEYYDTLAIVTRVSANQNAAGASVICVDYVMDEIEGTVIFDDCSVSLNQSISAADLKLGDVFVFAPDKDGIANWYTVLATTDDDYDFVLTDEVNTAQKSSAILGDGVVLESGYLLNEKRQTVGKGEIITYKKPDCEALVTASANQYTLATTERVIEVISGEFMYDADYMYQDNYDEDTYYACPVIIKTVNGDVTDIYLSNARIAQ